VALFRRAFPDLHISVDDTIEQGDRIATRTTVTGTQTGELMGLPATDRTISVGAVDIARFDDRRAVERWGGLDMYALLAQLGALPAPQAA
jgi:predicted ester cyclase